MDLTQFQKLIHKERIVQRGSTLPHSHNLHTNLSVVLLPFIKDLSLSYIMKLAVWSKLEKMSYIEFFTNIVYSFTIPRESCDLHEDINLKS